MKVKITFELDLADTSYNIDKVKLIPICLQNLGQWFYKLHCHYLSQKFDDLFRITNKDCTYNDAMKKAIMEHAEENLKLSGQMFNNYQVEGLTEDGHTFKFTHTDPGYNEATLVDGTSTYIEPCDE